MWWWFWLWILFVVFLIALPLGYGSGYRRWGAPYPRYYRGRGGRPVRVREDELVEPAPRRDGWGWFSDVVWLFFILAVVWIAVWAWVY